MDWVIMGVAGSGKSAVGRMVADRLGRPFLEGDDYHPPGNIAKMACGEPLDDADRWPWLDLLAQAIRETHAQKGPVIASCSALRKSYRDRLRTGVPGLRLCYLQIDKPTAIARMTGRAGHFMKSQMADSQFATLEPPRNALILDATLPIDALVPRIIEGMG